MPLSTRGLDETPPRPFFLRFHDDPKHSSSHMWLPLTVLHYARNSPPTPQHLRHISPFAEGGSAAAQGGPDTLPPGWARNASPTARGEEDLPAWDTSGVPSSGAELQGAARSPSRSGGPDPEQPALHSAKAGAAEREPPHTAADGAGSPQLPPQRGGAGEPEDLALAWDAGVVPDEPDPLQLLAMAAAASPRGGRSPVRAEPGGAARRSPARTPGGPSVARPRQAAVKLERAAPPLEPAAADKDDRETALRKAWAGEEAAWADGASPRVQLPLGAGLAQPGVPARTPDPRLQQLLALRAHRQACEARLLEQSLLLQHRAQQQQEAQLWHLQELLLRQQRAQRQEEQQLQRQHLLQQHLAQHHHEEQQILRRQELLWQRALASVAPPSEQPSAALLAGLQASMLGGACPHCRGPPGTCTCSLGAQLLAGAVLRRAAGSAAAAPHDGGACASLGSLLRGHAGIEAESEARPKPLARGRTQTRTKADIGCTRKPLSRGSSQ
jgi:hypothetical protein